ncbi:protein kinase domain-containing protein [Roseateles sp.]|uniref:serine/threonine-protein kinase n=1 Tax=Roseateles sp. TaxID=1971397 RepID=UPI003922050F
MNPPAPTDPSTTSAWREVMALFDRWLQADAAQRAALLAQCQAQQPALFARLQALIAADAAAEAGQFLEAMPAGLPVSAALAQPGQRLGAWTLLEPIGSGGMGQVWRAERSDGLYSAQVAIKLLHERAAALDTATAAVQRARFAREGELLARLSHPHIARLLDAGLTPEGARFLVLEHVSGQAIDAWCDEHRLDLPARLRLFLQVCEAVAFAHNHLVVHRDLKPANILVTDEGQAKLLDFGVAKLLNDDAGFGDSDLTREGAAGLTPAYAAPEQLNGQPISTATDVYALGVLLFQLLCGQRPYAGSASTPAQLVRDIVDTEPLNLGAVQPTPEAAAARGATPARLAQALRGDLAHIAARALQKLPSARYPSVQALAQDLQRYLDHEPVSARAPDWRYRTARFVRRHRWGVATSALLTAAVSVGVASTLWQADKAREQAVRAQAEAAKATAIKDFLLQAFNHAQMGNKVQGGGSGTTVLELIEKGGADLLADDKLAPEVRLELLTVLGELQRLNGLYAQAEGLQLKAQQLSREHFGERSEKHVYALVERAMTLPDLGRRAEADALLDQAIALMAGDASLQATESYPFALWQRGVNAFTAEDYVLALSLFERAAEACRAHRPKDPTYTQALQWQANVHARLDRFDAAQRALRQALPLAKASPRPEQGEAMVRLYLGDLLVRQGDFEAALAEYDPALALLKQVDSGRNADRAVALSKAARARLEAGQTEAAKADVQASSEIAQHHPGRGPGSSLADWATVAQLSIELGEGDLAAALPRARALAARWPQDAKASSYAAALLLLAEAELRSSAAGTANPAAVAAAERAVPIYEATGTDTLVARNARLVLAEVLAQQPNASTGESARAQFERVLAPALADATTPPLRARQLQKARALAGLAQLSADPTTAKQLAREGLALLGTPRYLRERQVQARLQALLGQR